ncbi:unnamed protein product [Toxocara canis]|uniref:Transposase n=1 Tax=Toxocara canis TaxID=6265 RepID=A0A183UKM7_TOXCA|nr:unnamed protein product [Toxocara canis]
MRTTRALCGNLNKIHWDRRVWEVGYRGPPLAQRKATGRPDYPVSGNQILLLRERFEREWEVMKCLATPYISKEQEEPYIRLHGCPADEREQNALRKEQSTMPGEPKQIAMHKGGRQRAANVGNLLHSHRTVEDSLYEVIRRQRWD